MGKSTSKPTPKSNDNNSKSKNNVIDLSIFKSRVDCVTIKGLDRTKDDYVKRAVKKLFETKNFEEMYLEARNCRDNLYNLGIFSNIRVLIDISKGKTATTNGYEIIFTGTELSRITGNIGTTIDNNEGALSVELKTPNLFGRGELVSINGSYSSRRSNDVYLKFWKAFHHTNFGDYKPETSISLFKTATSFPWSKYKLSNYGILFDFTSSLSDYISQSFQFESSIKEIYPNSKKNIPFFIREQTGPKLSTIFRYIIAYDDRDSTIFPTVGFHIKSSNETNIHSNAGVKYVSTNNHLEFNVPFFSGISAQVCGRFGILGSNQIDKVNISNLFMLGGPSSVRGFTHSGIGPSEENCAKGSRMYWAGGLHLWSPLPFTNPNSKFSRLFKTHIFYNAGNTEKISLESMRSSCGIGLAFAIGERARIELNYCHPIFYDSKSDSINKGFQFGIGYDFL